MDQTQIVDYLQKQYEELNNEWEMNQSMRQKALIDQLGAIGPIEQANPMMSLFKSGIDTLYGRPGFDRYKHYQDEPIRKAKTRKDLIDQYTEASGKELTDLQKAVLARMTARDQMNQASSVPFEGKVMGQNYLVTDRRTGVTSMIGMDQMPLYLNRVKQYTDVLKEQGGMSALELQTRANEMALADIQAAGGLVREMPPINPAMVGKPGKPTTPATQPSTVETRPLPPVGSETTAPSTNFDVSPEGIPEMDKFMSEGVRTGKVTPDQYDAWLEYKRNTVKPGVVAPTTTKNDILIRTPEERKADEEKLAETQKKLEALRASNQSLIPMEGVLLSGVNTSGQAHELLNKAGGYLNYIDPNGKLARAAGNDQMYYSEMMNLVREKIKALGSGTAVSNLDLIVTQKSVGDLRNTPQGNLKLLGIMKLHNAVMQAIDEDKINHYQKNRTFGNYKADDEPKFALRYRKVSDGGKGVLTTFDVESKDEWLNRVKQANGGKLPPESELNARWRKYQKDSIMGLANVQ